MDAPPVVPAADLDQAGLAQVVDVVPDIALIQAHGCYQRREVDGSARECRKDGKAGRRQ
jgi:hypothetical protein